jgi:hypothetical protein
MAVPPIHQFYARMDVKGSVGMSRGPLGPVQVEVTSFNAVSTYS